MGEFKKLYKSINAYLDTENAVQTAKRILIFEIVTITIFGIIHNKTNYNEFDAPPILSLLVSVISIIIAIIITYLFSKLFAEKSERIQRKYTIDELSHKVTLFRKIAFHIKGMREFWSQSKKNAKQKLDNKYKRLTYHQYRNLGYDRLHLFAEEVGDIVPQAYLALRGLENNENTYAFFAPFRPTNYTLEEISDFHEYTGSFWSMLDKGFKLDMVTNYDKTQIKDYYKGVTGKELDNIDITKDIKTMFNDVQSEIFEKLYYLTKLNETRFSKLFLSGLTNLLIFLIILIVSLIIYVVNPEPVISYYTTIALVSFFIANTVDLVVIIWLAFKTELNIKDFYKV
ncbi:hypothetical protein [Lutibacter flavus]|uniref:SMODS and SLOG-associating 2TM effector domain-containing protein n=1 Tax=Lutibacter flavus TaxID=691689 RepID=A0A238XIN4_9FLAO|nr:hypothetical protein [Lutibacter flavus]SNR58865.1 hypothetical protein SAMN04488111_1866 [Lutibacter flavus]